MTMPWLNRVDAVVETYFGGQAQGAALARVLWGDVNPSGKLTMTYPTSEDNLPPAIESPYAGAEDLDVVYGEGVNVGYKGYEAAGITPLFPFGFGLSYSSFRLQRPEGEQPEPGTVAHQRAIQYHQHRAGGTATKSRRSTSGSRSRPTSRSDWSAYSRVSTKAGESTMVNVTIDPKAATHPLGYFDTASDSWKIAPGTYRFEVGPSSRTLPLRATFTVG